MPENPTNRGEAFPSSSAPDLCPSNPPPPSFQRRFPIVDADPAVRPESDRRVMGDQDHRMPLPMKGRAAGPSPPGRSGCPGCLWARPPG